MPELTALTEEARQRALQRFEFLRPHLEQGRALNVLAGDAGVPYRTLQRWVALYRQFGLAALAHKPRGDRGGRRALSPELVQVIEGLALERPPRSAAAVYREVYQLAQRQGRKPPSYSLVHQVMRDLPADLLTLAHAGGKAYGDKYELIHRREADRPNAIWCQLRNYMAWDLLDYLAERVNTRRLSRPGLAEPRAGPGTKVCAGSGGSPEEPLQAPGLNGVESPASNGVSATSQPPSGR